MAEARNWHDPLYRAWRLAVKRRDGFQCRLCGSKKKLQAHHVKRWSDYPALRLLVANGATLCKTCHHKVSGNEEQYESLLSPSVCNPSVSVSLLQVKYGLAQGQVPGNP